MAKQLALVTGGMGGLGEAISVKLYDAVYTVVVPIRRTLWAPKPGSSGWLLMVDNSTPMRSTWATTISASNVRSKP